MNKKLLFSTLAGTALLLAGCKTAPTSTAEPTLVPVAKGETEEGMTDKIKQWTDAVKLGGGLKCTSTNTKSGEKVSYNIKGKKMHMTGIADPTNNTESEMITDTEYMYTWDVAKKSGFKMKLPTEAEMKASAEKYKDTVGNIPDFSNPETVQELEDDGYTMDCAPGVISDAEFVPPTDVKFQDFSTMMEDSMKKAQEGMTDEQKKQIEDAMKQYGEQ